jgi:hypothetical protein
MSWVRSNLRIGSWCALFALAVQLLVLFNHVHCNQNACWPASQPAIGSVSGGGDDGAADPKPATPAVGDYCLLCAVVHMAGTVLPAAAPAEPIALVVQKSLPFADLADISAAAPHGIFQARAPPRA